MVKGSIPTNVHLTLSFGRTVQKSSNGTKSLEYSFVPQSHQNGQAIACVATLQVGSQILDKRTNSTLKIEARPYNVSISGSRAMYLVGANITVTCHAEGNPSPGFVWNLPNNSSVTYLDNMKTLIISSAQTSHKGTYQCVAQNKYGDSFAQVDIIVEAEKSRSWVTAVVVVSLLAVVCGGGIIWYRCRSWRHLPGKKDQFGIPLGCRRQTLLFLTSHRRSSKERKSLLWLGTPHIAADGENHICWTWWSLWHLFIFWTCTSEHLKKLNGGHAKLKQRFEQEQITKCIRHKIQLSEGLTFHLKEKASF